MLTIVVIAFNRLSSLKKLLSSLDKADYCDNEVNLIISIDKGENEEIISYSEKFSWNKGKKKIIKHKENLGLKKHVLYCGNLTRIYGDICVFEDDLIVSPDFYKYSMQVLDFYKNESKIAGISLYSHPLNIENNLTFIPLKNELDVFLIQYAMSWGQVWTKKQWEGFYNWYEENSDLDFLSEKFPDHLIKWSDKSWLKYYIAYCITEDKYFLYPYNSVCTNTASIGTNSKISNKNFQVPLSYSKKKNYLKLSIFEDLIKYDAFFEPLSLDLNKFEHIENELIIDLYGEKNSYHKKYLLSSKCLNFKILSSFDLTLRPHELNVLYNIKGDYFFLYDTEKIRKNKFNLREKSYIKYTYYYPMLSFKVLKKLIFQKIYEKIYKKGDSR